MEQYQGYKHSLALVHLLSEVAKPFYSRRDDLRIEIDHSTSHQWLAKVELNQTGKEFVKQLRLECKRLHLGSPRFRGRNPNRVQYSGESNWRKHQLRQSLPLKYATWCGVYAPAGKYVKVAPPIQQLSFEI